MRGYATGYPMYENIDGAFQIQNMLGEPLYNGYVNRFPNETFNITVDIAPIMRQLVPMPDYTNFFKDKALIEDYSEYLQDKFMIRYESRPAAMPTSGPFANKSNVTSILIGKGLTEIPDSFSYNSSALETVIISSTVTIINPSAFGFCNNLKEIYVYATTPPQLSYDTGILSEYPFYNLPSTAKIYVPSASYNAYLSAWSDVSSNIAVMPSDMNSEPEVPLYSIVYTTNDGTQIDYDAPVGTLIYNGKVNNTYQQMFMLSNNNLLNKFCVFWDYTARNLYGSTNSWVTSWPSSGIQDYLYPYQYLIFSCITNLEKTDYEFYVKIGNDRVDFPICDKSFSYCLELNEDYTPVSDEEGADVIIYRDGYMQKSYKLKACTPDSGATIYFVNKYGTISWCHFDKKMTTKLNVERNQIENNSKIDNKTAFGISNFQVTEYYDYTLNTDWLDELQMLRLKDLFDSPAVWLQKLGSSTVQSVVLTDKNYTIKTKGNDKLFNVQIKCRDSQSYNIYA